MKFEGISWKNDVNDRIRILFKGTGFHFSIRTQVLYFDGFCLLDVHFKLKGYQSTPVNILKNQFSYFPFKQEGVGFKVNHIYFFPAVVQKLSSVLKLKKKKWKLENHLLFFVYPCNEIRGNGIVHLVFYVVLSYFSN